MGKRVQIKADYTTVLLPDGKPHGGLSYVDLTDAEYAALDAATLGAITLIGNVANPVRPSPTDFSVADLSADLSALKTSLPSTYGLLGGQAVASPVRRLYNKIAAMNTSVARVRWLTFGDSYAQKVYLQIAPTLSRIFGGFAGTYFGGSYFGVTNNADTGTVTGNTADVALWPSGLTYTLATAGASRTFGIGGGSITCDTIRVVHANTGGTFKIQVDGVDNTTPTVTNDNTVTVTTITVAHAAHTVTVVQLTGTPKIIGVGFEDTTISGLVTINVAQGDLDLSTITAQAWTNFATFLAAVTPDMLTLEAKESSSTFPTSLTSLFAATATAAPNMDVIGIGSPAMAVSAADADQLIQNSQLKTACTTSGYTFYDTNPVLGSYATLVALGWQGDGTHVDVKADRYRGMLMLRDLGLLNPDLLTPFVPVYVSIDPTGSDHAIASAITSATAVDVGSGTQATFTAPLSGKVLVTINAGYVNTAGAQMMWCLREGAADLAGTTKVMTYNPTVAIQGTSTYQVAVDGLVPGSAHTYKFGVSEGQSGSVAIYIGPLFGTVMMSVTAR
jgi:hypothetical protein